MAGSDKKLKNQADSGFTLLEMLIVLALLGMLAVVLGGSIYLGISTRNRVTAVALDQQDFSSFRRIMDLELARAYPDWVENGKYRAVDFEGGSDYLRFLAPALDVQGQGLAYYTLNMSQARGRPAILLKASLSATDPAPTLETHFAVGLASVHFEYFGISQDGSVRLWQENWRMRTNLPDLVAIQVTFPGGDRRSWPILVVHPDIDADVTCEIDPSTHRCAGR